MADTQVTDTDFIAATRRWLESVVIELNLCPFAGRALREERVRFSVTDAVTDVQLLQALEAELDLLCANGEIETTLVIHPQALLDFDDFNQFLDLADGLLAQKRLDGVFQIASFHPQYQFAETEADDAENYTNRSPHPMLHILREASLTRAIESTPDIDRIPARNIEQMNKLGTAKLKRLLAK